MTREELLAAGWEEVLHDGLIVGELYRHAEVLDGLPHELDQAIHAEEIRKTRDGGA